MEILGKCAFDVKKRKESSNNNYGPHKDRKEYVVAGRNSNLLDGE